MPIAMSQKEWDRIKGWTSSSDAEGAKRREYIQYLDNTSREMTKSWPNSLENMNKRNEEERLARIEAAEQANSKFYKRYLKRKKEEQEQLMYSARNIIFKNKDAPKLLLSAVIETVVQKERQEQIKFMNERRQEEAAKKRQEDDDIIRKAKEWNELNEQRRRKRFEVNKQHQKDILDQANEISERLRKEHETELNLQKIDNMNATAEMEAIKEFETNFMEREKARIYKDMEQAKMENEARKRENDARDKMDDRLIEVLNKSRASIEMRRKKTEQDIKKEKLRVLEAISAKLESGDSERDAKEQAILEKAIKQKLDADDARLEADRRKAEQFKKDRKDARDKFLRDEEQRLHEFQVRRQFEIMNRFKNAELFEEYKEKQREDKKRAIAQYREEILRLWKEREDREARERADTRYFYGELAEAKIRDGDNRVLTHALQLLDEARQHGRPDYALKRTIDQYCKMHRLYPMPEMYPGIAEHMREYAPADKSRPDPGYVPPLAPPAPDTSDLSLDHDHAKRDGLQDTNQAGPSKPAASKPENPPDDYKKVGRANGLQRRNAVTTLPTITAIPCTNPDCKCVLKP